MKLRELTITHFRNIAAAQFAFPGERNFFWGLNGQGKTNVLEAIGLALDLKSFRTNLKAPMVEHGAEQAVIRSVWQHEQHGETTLGVSFTPSRRTALLDGKTLRSVEEILGVFPVVSLTLANRELIYGGPAARRSEIDHLLCQIHPPYYQTLDSYAEALKARNKLLSDGIDSPAQRAGFEAQMLKCAQVMIQARTKVVAKLQDQLVQVFHAFSPEGESPRLVYAPQTPIDGLEAAWKNNIADELRRGHTTFGPHRDHVDILFNGELAEEYASEGQKFSIVLGLKLSGMKLLEERLDTAPVLVADDLLLELDPQRQEKFWQSVQGWQVFASGTTPPLSPGSWDIWRVEKGIFTKQ